MKDTGLLRQPLREELQPLVYGGAVSGYDIPRLEVMTTIDTAHVIMLYETGIVQKSTASALLLSLNQLQSERFRDLIGQPQPRGLYMAVEDYLRAKLGNLHGGALQTGRSRNDLNATVARIETRQNCIRVIGETLVLLKVLMRCAERHDSVVLPLSTHYQAAFPVFLGHYLRSVAFSVSLSLGAQISILGELYSSPLGACAGGGTSFPINRLRTAQLLNFQDVLPNSIEAVASRDFLLRFLSELAISTNLLSRLAQDLLTWSSASIGYIRFPDELVGSSSMMPQKRNAFLCEHIKADASVCISAANQALVAVHSTPFSNSIAVGTGALASTDNAVSSALRSLKFSSALVAGMEPNSEAMVAAAIDGCVCATYAAEEYVRETGQSYRDAHHHIGKEIRSQGVTGIALPHPLTAAKATEYGGGPGGSKHGCEEILGTMEKARTAIRNHDKRLRQSMAMRHAAFVKITDPAGVPRSNAPTSP